jgi:hypothetical protein
VREGARGQVRRGEPEGVTRMSGGGDSHAGTPQPQQQLLIVAETTRDLENILSRVSWCATAALCGLGICQRFGAPSHASQVQHGMIFL